MSSKYYLTGGVERHSHDGFTIYGYYLINSFEEMYKKRFIGYSISEARRIARKEIKSLYEKQLTQYQLRDKLKTKLNIGGYYEI